MNRVERWWIALLRQQRAAGFADFSGASASLVVPVADHLITQLVAARFEQSLKDFELHAEAGNRLQISARLRQHPWVPRLSAHLRIERQPQLPDIPSFVLRLTSNGASLALTSLRAVGRLPPELQIDGDLLRIDLRQALRRHALEDVLVYIRRLEITTVDKSVVLTLDMVA